LPLSVQHFRLLVRISIAGIAVTAILVTVNIWLLSQRSALLSEQRATRAELRASREIVAADRAERIALAASDKRNAQARCRGSIAGTAIANRIILNIKGTLLDLAAVATNPRSRAQLIARSRTFQTFPKPSCDTGESKS
jgi:hypothetical protein